MKSNIIIIGDIHLGKFKDDISLFITFMNLCVLPQCDKDTILIFTGDQFDSNSSIGIVLLSKVIDIFNKVSKLVKECHFIIGNHDTWKLDNIDDNASKFFSIYDNFYVHKDEVVEINGKKFHFLSFNEDHEKIIESIAKHSEEADYCISHQDILELYGMEHKPIGKGMNIADFENYTLVFNGHIHGKNTIDNFWNVGTPYQMGFSECGNQCGFHTLNTDDDTIGFHKNTNYPKHIKLEFKEVMAEGFDVKEFDNDKIWVVDCLDQDLLAEKMEGSGCLSFRTDTKVVENDVTDDFQFEHHDDVTDNTESYLKSLKEIPLKDKIVGVTPELVENLLILSNNL